MAGYNYIFGGDTGVTQQQLAEKRARAKELANYNGTPQNAAQGVDALGSAIIGRMMHKRAAATEQQKRAEAMEAWSQYKNAGYTGERPDQYMEWLPEHLRPLISKMAERDLPLSPEEQLARENALLDSKRSQSEYDIMLKNHELALQDRAAAEEQRRLKAEQDRMFFDREMGVQTTPEQAPVGQDPYAEQPEMAPPPVAGNPRQPDDPIRMLSENSPFQPEAPLPDVQSVEDLVPMLKPKQVTEDEAQTMSDAERQLIEINNQMKADAYRISGGDVSKYLEVLGKLKQDNLTATSALRQEFDKTSYAKNYENTKDKFGQIRGAMTSPVGTGTADMVIIFSFMKMLDDISVVRESEYEQAARSNGTLDTLMNTAQQFMSGGRLTEEGRRMFLTEAEKLYQQEVDYYNKKTEFFGETARNRGLPIKEIYDAPEIFPKVKMNTNELPRPKEHGWWTEQGQRQMETGETAAPVPYTPEQQEAYEAVRKRLGF